ncbi:hypothetical protein V500_07592 [Pseudogymnoascus sp. VKM F-4518 (FW-2643)]|nr:hypothetical protein V500_07592 [Pseudogymnoascus sp. VKM F-4518 (FW-2643)]
MRTAAQLFYLAVFALLHTSDANSEAVARNIVPEAADECAIHPKAIVSDACASYSTIDNLNKAIHPAVEDLTKHTDFFAYYRLNLFNKQCPFWNDEGGMCGNIACAVNTLDNEEDIPLVWRAEELSKLEGPKAGHPGRKQQAERGPERPLQGMLGEGTAESCVMEYDDECDSRDYCVPEDESATGKGDYVSLVDNPERFTGYHGASANQVWDAIYRENCFSRSSFPKSASLGNPKTASMPFPAANELKYVMQGGAKHAPLLGKAPSAETGFENEDECLEKRVFYRVVSGMHASISAHICQDSLNQLTGQWGPNLTCYRERLHQHPERISNLYFNYALVVRAVAKLGPYLNDYTYCSGDAKQDAETKSKVLAISAQAAREPNIFDESLMFVNGEGPSLKEDFRNRFRNISRMMDCVGCDKCRLWGKLQTNGYGTALKVLFEFDNPHALEGDLQVAPQLKRTELVALFNTLARISSSLDAVSKFRDQVDAEDGASRNEKGEKYHVITDRERLGRQQVPGKSYKYTSEMTEKERREMAEDEDEDEDIHKVIGDERTRRNTDEESVWEAICNESWLIYRIVIYIFKQWIGFPKVAYNIITNELSRLWYNYIGLPIPMRTWGWKRVPSPEEFY